MTYEVLPGLPPYGPEAEAFSTTGQGKHREGFVVQFDPDHGSPWVGNFLPGSGELRTVIQHPNGHDFWVISGGQGYCVDPNTHACLSTVGAAIQVVFEEPLPGMPVFGNGLWFEAIGKNGHLWRSGRISWDGMRELKVGGHYLRGEAWDPSDRWTPFELDLETGKFEGGSYQRTFDE